MKHTRTVKESREDDGGACTRVQVNRALGRTAVSEMYKTRGGRHGQHPASYLVPGVHGASASASVGGELTAKRRERRPTRAETESAHSRRARWEGARPEKKHDGT